MGELFWLIVLGISLYLLIKGADWFTLGAESVGYRLGMSSFVIGVLIVSVGTSLPELASSLAAVFQGTTEIVVANIVGSNIANSLLVLGIVALIGGGIVTKRDVAKVDMPILFVATIFLVLVSFNGVLSSIEASIFLALLVGYVWWLLKNKHEEQIEIVQSKFISVILLIGGCITLIISSAFLIESVVIVSNFFGISPAIISASIVAFGTSIPEIVVSILAVLKNKKDLALGNVLGSNIFNILLVGGVAGLFAPLLIDQRILFLGLPVVVLATSILWIFLYKQEINKIQGAGLVISYLLFLSLLFW